MPLDHPLADPTLQRYRDYARQRQMTLGDLLLENRIIFLEGVINDAVANMAVMKFLFLQYENRTQGISFYINSPGGSVTSTLAIYDTMQFIDCPVATYCIGLAASGAAVLLAGGTKGRRYRPAAFQDHDSPALRPGWRAGLRHRDPGRGDRQEPAGHQRDPRHAHRPADRADRQGHRARPLPDAPSRPRNTASSTRWSAISPAVEDEHRAPPATELKAGPPRPTPARELARGSVNARSR